METGVRRRGPGCFVCGEPVSPCPSPVNPPDLFNDLSPVVCGSVLLYATYPEFTRQELELKIKNGEIEGITGWKSNKHLSLQEKEKGYTERRLLPPLQPAWTGSMPDPRRQQSIQKTSYGFFSDLVDLQRQLVSGHRKWDKPPAHHPQIKSVATPMNLRSTEINYTIFNHQTLNKTKAVLFPPILDVWEQNDAMQRSIRLRI